MASSDGKYAVVHHPPITYLSYSATLPFSALPTLAHKIPLLYKVMQSTTPPTEPTGPPFFRYIAIPINMAGESMVEMEVGRPVPETFQLPELGQEDLTLEVKILPEGDYLETVHVGSPQTLMEATQCLLEYAERQGIEFDVLKAQPEKLGQGYRGSDEQIETETVDRWKVRLEWYESDPSVVKDVNEWRTRLSFKIKEF